MLGGPVVFLAGRAIFDYIVFAPAMRDLPPLVTAVVLSDVATADTVRTRGRPNETPVPPR